MTEIQGVTSSGKTQLLIKLAVNHLLPRRVHVRLERQVVRVSVGGKEAIVTWFHCTASKFDIHRVSQILRFHLVQAINQFRRPKGIGAPTEEELDSLVAECLTRLHVFSPTSTLQLAATLQTLPEWYEALNISGGGGLEDLGCVIIDGMTEFAWPDQYEREQQATSRTHPPSTPPPLQLFSSSISRLRETVSPLVFISQWVLRPSHPIATPSQQNLPFYRPHFNPPLYPSLSNPPFPRPSSTDPLSPVYYPSSPAPLFPIHFHITLHPSPRPIFRKGVSLAMVLKEGTRNQASKRDVGVTTEGIVCVLRKKGGKELGSWEMEIGENEIIA